MNSETTKPIGNTTALATLPAQNMTAMQVCTNMTAINALGQTLAQSGFFGAVSASTATAALVNCFLEGLTPMQYKAKYHTFDNGQTGVKSEYIQREFQKLGGEWEFVEWTADKCDMRFVYKGKTLPFCVTLDEFRKNGVACKGDGKTLKDNWRKFPREMLKARCMTTAIRALCPQALEGMYTQEEVADFASPHYTPQRVVKAVSQADAAEVAAEVVDYGVCPCGSVKGKRWEELPTETLEKVLATPEAKAKALTAEHRNAIIADIARRKTTADGEISEDNNNNNNN